MSESLFFIAIVPPQEIQEEITQLKLEVAEKYGSRHALKSPPHITLHMPFRWKDKKLEKLIDAVRLINEQVEPFTVKLKDFNFFEPRVVFVDVLPNERLDMLQQIVVSTCRKQLNLDNANYKNRPFHPHVTIGFRDLKKPMFYKAKEEFEKREIDLTFEVNEIVLLKHDGSKWNILNILD